MRHPLPKISVITVSYNQGEFIRQNIESVLAQNYPNFEHIVVDGGSTDSTVEILKSYPHLKWTSERDRGQSDALNKGFARATGDIIAWLNSDDWYAEGLFHDLASQMGDYPVLIGQAAQTDREGRITQVVQNTPRSFYDLLRYWIPLAWLAQPSVFFTRALLEEVKRPDGTYIDEDLYFAMDLDLWFRMALKHPFVKHIDRVLSYFRMYDENKTGARPHATQRECSRVFRRYVNGAIPIEQRLSYIIPINTPTESLKATIISLTKQSALDFDILLVDYAEDRATSKAIHSYALDLCEVVPQITIRHIRSDAPTEFEAFNTGVRRATAPTVALLQPGDIVDPNTTREAIEIFARDVVGLVFPQVAGGMNPQSIIPSPTTVSLAEIISGPFYYPNIFARRLALLELGPFRSAISPSHAIKELYTRLFFRGWAIEAAANLSLTATPRDYSLENARLNNGRARVVEALRLTLKQEMRADPFAPIRAAVRDPRPLFE